MSRMKAIVDAPAAATGPRVVTELFAFVVVDLVGDEGVLRRVTPVGTQPMIADSLERLEAFRAEAVRMSDDLGLPFNVVRFVRAEASVAPADPMAADVVRDTVAELARLGLVREVDRGDRVEVDLRLKKGGA